MYAIIEDGIVVNTVAWDGDHDIWTPPDGVVAIEVREGDVPHIGLGYANGIFEQPQPLVPYDLGQQ